MKLHLAPQSSQLVFTGYGADHVLINDERHGSNLVLLSNQLVPDWAPAGFAALTERDFEALLALKPEMVLLGTGMTLRFPHPRLSQCLASAGIGMDVMDIHAVCRTYNVLVGEGRNAAAALLFN